MHHARTHSVTYGHRRIHTPLRSRLEAACLLSEHPGRELRCRAFAFFSRSQHLSPRARHPGTKHRTTTGEQVVERQGTEAQGCVRTHTGPCQGSSRQLPPPEGARPGCLEACVHHRHAHAHTVDRLPSTRPSAPPGSDQTRTTKLFPQNGHLRVASSRSRTTPPLPAPARRPGSPPPSETCACPSAVPSTSEWGSASSASPSVVAGAPSFSPSSGAGGAGADGASSALRPHPTHVRT